jgi:hypothetical protein
MAYDPDHDEVILFGGYHDLGGGNFEQLNDTWA